MSDEVKTTREIEATLIPYGDRFQVPEGTPVTITHRLGGSFTVTGVFGMARVDGKDADALGEEIPPEVGGGGAAADDDHEGPPEEEKLWDALKMVFDPEIPVNIVDLGLVYNLEVKPRDEGGHHVTVDMTLTAPGCGMGPTIAQDAKMKIEQVPGATEADVRLVWDPPWHQDMISEVGKMELGLL